jgi:hypothetical protein
MKGSFKFESDDRLSAAYHMSQQLHQSSAISNSGDELRKEATMNVVDNPLAVGFFSMRNRDCEWRFHKCVKVDDTEPVNPAIGRMVSYSGGKTGKESHRNRRTSITI